jgi:hypothetical protein
VGIGEVLTRKPIPRDLLLAGRPAPAVTPITPRQAAFGSRAAAFPGHSIFRRHKSIASISRWNLNVQQHYDDGD